MGSLRALFSCWGQREFNRGNFDRRISPPCVCTFAHFTAPRVLSSLLAVLPCESAEKTYCHLTTLRFHRCVISLCLSALFSLTCAPQYNKRHCVCVPVVWPMDWREWTKFEMSLLVMQSMSLVPFDEKDEKAQDCGEV